MSYTQRGCRNMACLDTGPRYQALQIVLCYTALGAEGYSVSRHKSLIRSSHAERQAWKPSSALQAQQGSSAHRLTRMPCPQAAPTPALALPVRRWREAPSFPVQSSRRCNTLQVLLGKISTGLGERIRRLVMWIQVVSMEQAAKHAWLGLSSSLHICRSASSQKQEERNLDFANGAG